MSAEKEPDRLAWRNNLHRSTGRYAQGWRHGFTSGAVDALRVAARRLPPETWWTLARLADEYERAGDD